MDNPADKIRMAVARRMLFAAAAVLSAAFCSCDRIPETEGALYSCDDYTVYPDSFVSASLTVAVRGDSVITRDESGVRVGMEEKEAGAGLSMDGSDALIAALFNRETNHAGYSYDRFTAYEIYISDGLANPDSAAVVVDSRIAGGEVAELAEGVYRWPVAMSDATWGIAAATVSSMTDDEDGERKRALALKKLIDRDIRYVYDRNEGLFAGVPAEMDARQLPGWADAGDAAVMMTLEGNIGRLCGMRYVNEVFPESYEEGFVDGFSENISKRFWIPNLGMLSQTLYERPYPISVTASDNLVQGLAVATGCSGEAMSVRIVSNTPVTTSGVPVTYPDQGISGDSRREALTAALWAIASARVGNGRSWALSYGSLVAMSVTDDYALRLLKGVTLRTLFGLDPAADGLKIQPYVHEALGDYHRISGLRYRGSELTVTVRGRGDVISTFAIDGEVRNEAIVPRDISGRHDIEVVLAGSGSDSGEINVARQKQMPRAPKVAVEGGRKFSIESDEAGQYIVYLNGSISEITGSTGYELYNAAPVTAVCFEADVSNVVTGYASKSYLYIPPKDSVSLRCDAVAQRGGRVLAKKELASKYVESTRYKNARMVFEYESAAGGDYYVRLRYLDGLGIVNKNRLYALRLLKVNGDMAGIMVLPQRGPEMWSPAEDWASMAGTTQPIAVTLTGGRNEIVIEYFTPEGVAGFDHDGNTVIPVALELIKR